MPVRRNFVVTPYLGQILGQASFKSIAASRRSIADDGLVIIPMQVMGPRRCEKMVYKASTTWKEMLMATTMWK